MISLGAVSGDGASYYAADNYYTANEGTEQSAWAGKAAEALQLSGKVDPTTFEQVLAGTLPDGTQLDARRGEHRPGLDLTFSASKSVSLLALVGGDKRIVTELREAVGATLEWIEKTLIEARVSSGSQQMAERTGNMLAATFLHDVNRNQEPQLHIHAVIANATHASDGKWHALRNDALYTRQHAISAVFNAELRHRLEALGYQTEPARNPIDGAFEIAGVSRQVVEAFSTRSTEIREALAAQGRSSPREREIAALTTRQQKEVVPDPEARAQGWAELAGKLGFNAERLVDAARERLERGQSMWGQVVAGIKGVGARGAALVATMGLTPRDDDALVPERKGRLEPRAYATAQAVASASRDLSEREAGFDRLDLIEGALGGIGPMTVADVEKRIDLLISKGLLVGGERMLTPTATLRLEERILDHLNSARGVVTPMMDRPEAAVRVQEAARDLGLRRLNPGQQAAAVAILSTADRVHYVQGGAGVGKSAALGPVAAIAQAEGRTVHALAVATRTAREFGEKVGAPGKSVSSFIARHRGVLDGSAGTEKLAAAKAEIAGSFIMVDEASMVPNHQFEQILRIAAILGAERVVMAGDTRQLLAVEAGKPFELTQAHGAPTSHIAENLRAASPQMKAVNAALAADDVAGALKALEGHTLEVGRQEAAGIAANRWTALPIDRRDATVLLSPSRAMRSAINAAVQDELRAKDEIGERALELTVLERVSVTREGTRQMRAWQEGNVVAFETALPSQGFARGERGVVVESAGDRATLHMGDGVLKDIVPGRIPKNLCHDAVSVFREKTIALHEGDRIRWTTNDRARGLLNNQQAEVAAIKDDAVTFRAMDGTLHDLKTDDRMLERLDLAYALTVHAAQGMTATSGILVMREEDRRLNSTRSFLVATTRVTDNLTLIVDNAQAVERAVSRNAGDKTSAIAIARDAAPSPALDLPELSLERSR
ncbi:MobF family relaxase [Novosphingobium panipatense]|uniref:Conjugative relaxase domain-containing protein, TrwC/TraI family n=2 Tax=Novosphingobium panipatense TaxID=428991 RepID=A0ABY1QW43_9SPHN|nr:MobF family relaxase [Novosphingobium panipatense]SMP82648.1 conjugative relaxase domain-containing protein, TrwC/TraI family [Novosphingobium panipatense]